MNDNDLAEPQCFEVPPAQPGMAGRNRNKAGAVRAKIGDNPRVVQIYDLKNPAQRQSREVQVGGFYRQKLTKKGNIKYESAANDQRDD